MYYKIVEKERELTTMKGDTIPFMTGGFRYTTSDCSRGSKKR